MLPHSTKTALSGEADAAAAYFSDFGGRALQNLLRVSAVIDSVLGVIAKIGAWMGLLLVLLVCYDVITRYFGVPKAFGLNSTQLQESEYWLHTFLFSLMIGYAYTRQAHVRIDLLRDRLPLRVKYLIEMVGIVVFLMTYVVIGTWFTFNYVHQSFLEGEVSKSTIGLSHIWVLKAFLPTMFVLLGLAGISQLIKATAGFSGKLPQERIASVVGGDM